MPSESEIPANTCFRCTKTFETGQDVYERQDTKGRKIMFCFDDFVKELKHEMTISNRRWWNEPFLLVYYRFFGDERRSTYVKPLTQAMTELVVEEMNQE